MNDVQVEILNIFREYKRICDDNKLRYFAIGGTCIGAIRHHGFIPWDDDLDVAMPWDDYIKFRTIANEIVQEPYEVYNPKYHRHSELRFLKLHNGKTAFIEECQKKNYDRYTGIFMDIMPIVGFPDDESIKEKFFRKCIWYSRLNIACRFEIKYKHTLKSKLFSVVTKPLTIGKPFDFYFLKYEELIAQNIFGETSRVLFPWRIPVRVPYRNLFPYEIFKESIEVPFEDTMIRVPKEYDMYLKMDFGDYMKLPPEGKRCGGHPAVIVDFEKSYREYREEKQ